MTFAFALPPQPRELSEKSMRPGHHILCSRVTKARTPICTFRSRNNEYGSFCKRQHCHSFRHGVLTRFCKLLVLRLWQLQNFTPWKSRVRMRYHKYLAGNLFVEVHAFNCSSTICVTIDNIWRRIVESYLRVIAKSLYNALLGSTL